MSTSPPPSVEFDYVLVGGGLSNALIALALFQQRPKARVALVEQQATLGGNHLWCFHAGDIQADAVGSCDFVTPLVARRWPRYDVHFPDLHRTLEEPYAAVPSERLNRVVRSAFAEHGGRRLFLSAQAQRVTATTVSLASGLELRGDVVIESRGPAAFEGSPGTGYQKFVGLELELNHPSPLANPVLMDAVLPQRDGFRFMYALPLARARVLLEDTYFSDSAELRDAEIEAEIMGYAQRSGMRVRAVVRRESGVLPLPTSVPTMNEPEPNAPLQAGFQGGWFHPTTGYSFPVAVRVARAVASCEPVELRQRVWPALQREQRSQLRFGVLLNRLMFNAFAADERYRAIERFYRLPAAAIRRFYALSLNRSDRLRLMCGRPPRGFSLPRLVSAELARGGAAS
jgi:lycopene beta-cyclase